MISGVIRGVTMVITPIMGLLTPFITTHEPLSIFRTSRGFLSGPE